MASLITNPARYEVGPSWTMPFNTGGDQSDDNTRSPVTAARALFTTSHPAIFPKNSSVSSTGMIQCARRHREVLCGFHPNVLGNADMEQERKNFGVTDRKSTRLNSS